jgi:hypothetical protein
MVGFFKMHGESSVFMQMFVVACWDVASETFADIFAGQAMDPSIDALFLNHYKGKDYQFREYWQTVYRFFDTYKRDKALWAKRRVSFMGLQASLQEADYKSRKGGVIRMASEDGDEVCLSELVIVLDEARTLLGNKEPNAFRNLRRALKDLGCRNVVVVLIDTISTISNFAPAESMDPSFRRGERFKLLAPYYELTTTHNRADASRGDGLDGSVGELAEVFSLGRQLWRAYCFRNGVQTSPEDIRAAVTFAGQKLTYRLEDTVALGELAVVALFSVRFGIAGVTDHTLGSTLMSAYMGTCRRICG